MNVIIKLWVQTLGEGYVPKIKHRLVRSQWAIRGTFLLEGIKNKVKKMGLKLVVLLIAPISLIYLSFTSEYDQLNPVVNQNQ